MYFLLSKVLWFFAAPTNLLVSLVVGGGLLLFTRWWRGGRALVAAGALGLLVAGYLPLGSLLIAPLENRFPAWTGEGPRPDGIVVLGGPVQPRETQARGALALNDGAERIVAMADLARRFPDLPVIFTGGAGDITAQAFSEADALEAHLAEFGLPPGRVQLERKSRNTLENALFTRDILKPRPGQRWLLVTSAFHMPRSVALFRAAGLDVVAYPVDFRTGGPDDLARPFLSASDGLRRTDVAVREWIGLIAARLLGQTRELLASP